MQLESMISTAQFEDHKYEPSRPGTKGHNEKKEKEKKRGNWFCYNTMINHSKRMKAKMIPDHLYQDVGHRAQCQKISSGWLFQLIYKA